VTIGQYAYLIFCLWGLLVCGLLVYAGLTHEDPWQ
jgi:hypothetical protein